MYELKTVLFGYLSLMLCQDLRLLASSTSLAHTYDRNRYHVYQKQLTWNDADLYCATRNMKLAEILSYKQLNDLRAFTRGEGLLPKNSESGYWLGAKLRKNEWIWVSSEQKLEDQFMAGWHFQQPNRKERNGVRQECMELQYKTGSKFVLSLSWNDLWCDEKRGVVCEAWDDNPPAN